jgi:hypothetical protein
MFLFYFYLSDYKNIIVMFVKEYVNLWKLCTIII